MLSRAYVGRLRSRCTTYAIVALQNNAINAVKAQFDGEGQTNRARAYD
jgi:hypothetical protein